MNRTKAFFGIACIACILLYNSCSRDILDRIDTDPNNPVEVPVKLILPVVQTNLAYSVIGGDMSLYLSVWIQHVTGVHAQLFDADRFAGITTNLVNNTWNSIYLSVLKNSNIIIDQATEDEAWPYVGIAQVLYAYSVMIATDSWGRIPYTEALQGSANRQPAYDNQQEIYTHTVTGIMALLDEAITNLTRGGVGPGSDDLVYKGDLNKWVKAANGLKAKMMTRLSKRSQYEAQYVINAANNSFASSADGFVFTSFTAGATSEHPWEQESKDRTHFAVSESFFNLLSGLDDPRGELFFDDGYASIPAPNGTAQQDQGGGIYTKIYDYVRPNSPIEFMTYDELMFAKAEAHLRLGQDGDAYTAYQDAVNAALLRAGVSQADADVYMMQSSVSPGSGNLTFEHIWTQKYISYYPFQSVEGFAEWRRTGTPNLTNPNGDIPRRVPYPQGEIDNNRENVPFTGVVLDRGVWWDDGSED